MVIKNQNKYYSILEDLLVVLGYVIIVVSVCGCKKSGLSTEQRHKFVFEGYEIRTASGEPIIVVTEVVWRIVEPEDFLKALETVNVANFEEELLRSWIRNTKNNVIGRHYFSEFINPDPNKIQIPQIEQEMLTELQQFVSDAGWGIEIEKVFIKQVKVREELQEEIRRILEPIESENVPVKSVEEEPAREKSSSESPVSLDDRLYKQSKIAFVSEKDGNLEIYVVNVDGSGLKNLTNNPARDLDPSWSPDGTKIAFHSYRYSPETYVMNADGSEQKRLYSNSSGAFKPPSWSPDGKKIAFVSLEEARISGDKLVRMIDIYVSNIDGSEQKKLTNNFEDLSPTWSPDGTKIAFYSNRDGNSEIYVMNADGSEQKRLTNNSASDTNPSWSPDGKRIAFESVKGRSQEIYVMNADGSGLKKLTDHYWMDKSPPWSPDGTKIAFISYIDGNLEIYVVNTDGSGQKRLTKNPAMDTLPSWSPDGTKIAFVSSRDGQFEVYVMNADGSGQKRLTNNPARGFWFEPPSWSPFLSTANVSSDDNLYTQSHKTVFEGVETPTAGSIPIIVDTEVVWRIAESQQLLNSDNTLDEIEVLLRNPVLNSNDKVIGRHKIDDFVKDDIKYDRIQDIEDVHVRAVAEARAIAEAGFINSETSESKAKLIQDEILTRLQQSVSDAGLGIEIEKVIIKQIRFSKEIQRSILENRR